MVDLLILKVKVGTALSADREAPQSAGSIISRKNLSHKGLIRLA